MTQSYILVSYYLVTLLIGLTTGVSGGHMTDKLQFDDIMAEILSNSNGSPDVEHMKGLLVQAKEKSAGFDYFTTKLVAKDLEDLNLLLSVGIDAICSVEELNKMGQAMATFGVDFRSLTHYLNHFQRRLVEKCNARLHEEISLLEFDKVPDVWLMLINELNKVAPGYTTLEYLIGDIEDARSAIVENYEKILKSKLFRLKTPTESWYEYYTTLKDSLESFQKSICEDKASHSLLQILPGFLHLDLETQYISNLDREKRATLERAMTCEYMNIVDKEKLLDEYIVQNYDGAMLYDLVFPRNDSIANNLAPEDIHVVLSMLYKYTNLTNETVTRDMIGRRRVSYQVMIPLGRPWGMRSEVRRINRFVSNTNLFPSSLQQYHQTYIPMYIESWASKMIKSIQKDVPAIEHYDEFMALSESFPDNIQKYLTYVNANVLASGVAKFLIGRGMRLRDGHNKLGFMHDYVREVCRAGYTKLSGSANKLELLEELNAKLENSLKLTDLLGARSYQLLSGTYFCKAILDWIVPERYVVQEMQSLTSQARQSQQV